MADPQGTDTGTPCNDLEQYRDKVFRLLRYLEEFVKLKVSTPVLDLDRYRQDGLLLWFKDLPRTKGVFCQAWQQPGEGQAELWLEVRKQELPICPSLPPDVEPWVESSEVHQSGGQEPKLKPVAYLPAPLSPGIADPIAGAGQEGSIDQGPAVVAHRIEDHAEVAALWRRYLERWRPWSEEHARRAPVQRAYAALYAAYQKQKRLGETYELVVGLGLLSRRQPNGAKIRRHVLVAQAQLEFDAKRGVIAVKCPPPPEGARVQIEDEFLDQMERPLPEHYTATQQRLRDLGDAVWDRAQVDTILTAWANAIPPEPGCTYSQSLDSVPEQDPDGIVSLSPALILRKRTVRGTLALYRKLIEAVERGAPIPFGLARLVAHLKDEQGNTGTERDPVDRPAADSAEAATYFPLPANDEQRSIVDRLRHVRGILVQGPPGTGKSQTIANLICHLLATGRRVLVTSETPHALAVLKEKIPTEVRPLCVSLLGADTASMTELEAAVGGITRRHSHWSPEASKREVVRLEQELLNQGRHKAELARQLREFHESEAKDVTIGDGSYRGTAAAIAMRVQSERDTFGWLRPSRVPSADPPLRSGEALELLQLTRELGAVAGADIERFVAPLASMPQAHELARCVAAETAAKGRASQYDEYVRDSRLAGLFSASQRERAALRVELQGFVAAREALLHRTEPWVGSAVKQILSGHDSPWVVRRDRTESELEGLRDAARASDETRVELPDGVSEETVLADATAMAGRLESGHGWGFFGLWPRVVRGRTYLARAVKVNGRLASGAEELRRLILVLSTRRRLRTLKSLWKDESAVGKTSLETQVAASEEDREALNLVFDLNERSRQLASVLASLQPAVLPPDWAARKEVTAFVEALDAAEAVDSWREASAVVEGAAVALREAEARKHSHPVNAALLDSLIRRDLQAWSEAYGLAELVHRKQERFHHLLELRARLSEAAPELPETIRQTAAEPAWDSRLAAFEDAWRWAQADHWLQHRREPGLEQRVAKAISRCDDGIGSSLSQLAAELAWQHFFEPTRFTPRVRENLVFWKLIVARIGKGTGKHAESLRTEARRAMEVCVESIPAWIIPRYRVAEAFEPRPELFDVVIVDEASQTGIEGLFLYGLAKQIIVVGDDQQISPEPGFVSLAAVAALAKLFLTDIPFPAALEPGVSLYAHAEQRFSGKIVLREHFRCVPEIIGFSDRLCYAPHGTPLVPLRRYPPQRLDPIVTRLVRDGFQEGKSGDAVNRPEANALVGQIIACLGDANYKDKTMGVISLLGEAQARLVERLLLVAVGPQAMEGRKLVCGDAYAFQGDERDVIFLSMVSAPNARIGTLAGLKAQQRFNVAASRAKDQLWLFHTATIEDLGVECMRRKLLEYCIGPNEPDEEEEPTFATEFERGVYERIRARGYRVRTQVPGGDQLAHRYRIDLVVEGRQSRLAVECDGDSWHGADRFEADMARQRQLERAGWVFCRVWASDFYRDPEAALAPAWEALNRLRIEPHVEFSRPAPTPPAAGDLVVSIDMDTDGDMGDVQPDLVSGQQSDNGLAGGAAIVEPVPAENRGSAHPAHQEVPTPAQQPPGQLTPEITPTQPPPPRSDAALLAYFDSVSAGVWASLSAWAKQNPQWSASQRKVVARVGKAVAAGNRVTDSDKIWAARLHVLALKVGFHDPHGGGAPQSRRGQLALPLDDSGDVN